MLLPPSLPSLLPLRWEKEGVNPLPFSSPLPTPPPLLLFLFLFHSGSPNVVGTGLLFPLFFLSFPVTGRLCLERRLSLSFSFSYLGGGLVFLPPPCGVTTVFFPPLADIISTPPDYGSRSSGWTAFFLPHVQHATNPPPSPSLLFFLLSFSPLKFDRF